MKKNIDTKIGCLLTIVVFVLIAVLYTQFRPDNGNMAGESDDVTWVDAVETCKERYRNISPSWKVKVPNCRKRTDDDLYFYFSWSKPVSIFVETSAGKKSANEGFCQVEKKTGKIVHMTFNNSVIVKKD